MVSSEAQASQASYRAPPGEATDSLLSQQAQQLARRLGDVVPGNVNGHEGPPLLLERLKQQESILQAVYLHFAQAPKQEVALSYAAEWLLDNHYIIEQALRQIREDLPLGYYHHLPLLAQGDLAGFPRVYAIALEMVSRQTEELD